MRRGLGLLITAVVAFGQQRSFVTCPIVRDTKTVPCFLAEYEGETYFLGIQQDISTAFHPPQLKHEVLVEGRMKQGPRVCGGIPLEPVAISVVKELNLACNTLLPSEPGIEAPTAPRGAGPSSRRAGAPPVREPLAGVQEFAVRYQFDDTYLEFGPSGVLNEAAAYAKRISASKVKVTGYRATSLLSNGMRMVEKDGLAEKRAQAAATLLRGLGLGGVEVEWVSQAQAGDGISDAGRRRVMILVTP
jgi:outer membrane protein OmpA-like peptidoglycan-associated protein